MLKVYIEEDETFDEETSTFGVTPGLVLYLEHSLVSMSRWEAKSGKPFLGGEPHTHEETRFYIECMFLGDYPSDTVRRLSVENFRVIQEYVESGQTATTFNIHQSSQRSGNRREIITSELIYYWMVAFGIPFECESWHLNRLFSLIQICSVKNSAPKKIGRNEMAQRNRELNAERRAQYNTRG